MGVDMRDRRQEIDDNLSMFLKELPRLLPLYKGKFALLRHKQIVAFYDTVSDAVSAANSICPDEIFSIQEVTDMAADAGFYSHALPLGTP
jgi:hypothetical protein